MNKQYTRDAGWELVQAMCQLVDDGQVMSRDAFHELCESEQFIETLLSRKNDMRLSCLNKNSPLYDPDVLAFWSDALGRHANVVVMEEFGLKSNALLLGINLCLQVICREIDGPA